MYSGEGGSLPSTVGGKEPGGREDSRKGTTEEVALMMGQIQMGRVGQAREAGRKSEPNRNCSL